MSIYLDYAATTPLDEQVFEAMVPYLKEAYGNPSSLHKEGQRVRHAVETAREQVASAIGAQPQEIIFSSGATEADNHAIRAVVEGHKLGKKAHVITSQLEHSAVLTTCQYLAIQGYDVTFLEPNSKGEITVEALQAALKEETVLVALMLANNETGVITDITAMSEVVHEAGALMFCDAVQGFGTLDVNVDALGVDLLSLSAHKVYGPKGVGALYMRKGVDLVPMMLGGEQERGYRAGTLNSPAIIGMGEASSMVQANWQQDAEHIAGLRDNLQVGLLAYEGINLNAAGAARSPKHINVYIKDVDGEAMLMGLDQEGIMASAGSACAAGSIEPSHVLIAMGMSKADAKASIRFSLGRFTTEAEVDEAVRVFGGVLERCRKFS